MNDRHIEGARRCDDPGGTFRVLAFGAWFGVLVLPGCHPPQFKLMVQVVIPEEVQNELADQFPLALYVVGLPARDLIIAELCEQGEDLVIFHEDLADCDGGPLELEYFLAPIEFEVASDCGELEGPEWVSAPEEEFRVGPSTRLQRNVDSGLRGCDPDVVHADIWLE
ncbi:MAG: hypothetical protein AAF735_05165 [Myxococcota bacterium]